MSHDFQHRFPLFSCFSNSTNDLVVPDVRTPVPTIRDGRKRPDVGLQRHIVGSDIIARLLSLRSLVC